MANIFSPVQLSREEVIDETESEDFESSFAESSDEMDKKLAQERRQTIDVENKKRVEAGPIIDIQNAEASNSQEEKSNVTPIRKNSIACSEHDHLAMVRQSTIVCEQGKVASRISDKFQKVFSKNLKQKMNQSKALDNFQQKLVKK